MRIRSFIRSAPDHTPVHDSSPPARGRRTRPTRSSLFSGGYVSRQSKHSPNELDSEEECHLIEPDIEEDNVTLLAPSPKSAQSDEFEFPFCDEAIRYIRKSRFTRPSLFLFLFLIIIIVLVAKRAAIYTTYLRAMSIPSGLYSRDGKLCIGRNTPFHIKGFSWYGMEEDSHILGGLSKVSVHHVLHFAKQHQFNAIRLPLSIENLRANPMITSGVGTFQNGDLSNKHYIDVIKAIVEKAADNFILIVLDIHRLHNGDVQSKGLWYADDVSEDRLTEAWKLLSTEFKDEWNVIGADLYNEPWDATWSSAEDDDRNWKRAAEKLGNMIHETCPSWLIFIEGVGNRAGKVQGAVFWSENLHVMQEKPPELKLSHKAVLSPHVYGPSVYMQDYFKPKDFIKGMPKMWDNHFGKASNVTGLATVVGEWGGTLKDKDRTWQVNFLDYLVKNEISFFYWCLNPESADTGGLLHNDWKTPVDAKIDMLRLALSTNVEKHVADFYYGHNWHIKLSE